MYKTEMLALHPDGPFEIRIWNLTPHAVVLHDDRSGGHPSQRVTIEPERGYPLRAKTVEERIWNAMVPWSDVVKVSYRGVDLAAATPEGSPPPLRLGDILIVSTLAADAWEAVGWEGLPVGVQVYVPDSGPTAVRDERGQVEAVRRLIARKVISEDDFMVMCHPDFAYPASTTREDLERGA